jgi:DNA-binding CsgD family transcriptional regulator
LDLGPWVSEVAVLGELAVVALDRCYQTVFDADEFPNALEQLAHAYGAGGCSVVRHGGASRLSTPASPLYRQFLDEFVADGWASRDLRAKRGWPQLKAGKRVLLEHDVVSDEERSTLDVYRDIYTRHDLYWWATVPFSIGSEFWALSFLRSRSAEPFGRMETEGLKLLGVDMARLMRLSQAMAKTRSADLVSTLGVIGEPAVVVSEDMTVQAFNDQAWLELEPEIHVRQGRLAASCEAGWDAITLLRTFLRSTGSPSIQNFIVLRRDTAGKRPLVLDVLRLDPLTGHGPLALITLRNTDKRGQIDRSRLQDVFRLSTAEAKLAEHLARGATLDGAAAQLGIGHETVRTQLKALFEKCGCRRQADLAILLVQAGE